MNVPSAHAVQSVAPPELYFPLSHRVQGVDSATSSDHEPAAQAVHAEAAYSVEYEPTTHDEQAELPGMLVYMPALQPVQAVTPARYEYEPAAQFVHTARVVAPTAVP